jgi:hypothetical protein
MARCLLGVTFPKADHFSLCREIFLPQQRFALNSAPAEVLKSAFGGDNLSAHVSPAPPCAEI